MKAEFRLNGTKTAVVHVSGEIVDGLPVELLRFDEMKAKGVILNKILHLFQGKSGLILRWKDKELTLIGPIEGRGKLDFEDFHGIPSPKDATGVLGIPYGTDPRSAVCCMIFDVEKV